MDHVILLVLPPHPLSPHVIVRPYTSPASLADATFLLMVKFSCQPYPPAGLLLCPSLLTIGRSACKTVDHGTAGLLQLLESPSVPWSACAFKPGAAFGSGHYLNYSLLQSASACLRHCSMSLGWSTVVRIRSFMTKRPLIMVSLTW